MAKKVYTGADFKIIIDEDKCTGCGDCVDACPSECYSEPANEKANVSAVDECVGCKACESQCPEEAIEIIDV